MQRIRRAWLSGLLLLTLLAGCGGGSARQPQPAPPPTQPTPAPAQPPPDPVRELLDSLSLDQKLGQLVLVGVDGQRVDQAATELIRDFHVGGVILYQDNIASAGQTVDFLNGLKAANAGNPVPLWLGVDQEGGPVSRMPPDYEVLPAAGEVGATGDAEYAAQIGSLLGAAVKSLGFNMNFAPVLDINSNPDNPVIGVRAFGATPDVVSKMGLAAMGGIQAENVVAVVKHFPGHGDTGVDSHLDLPLVAKSLEELRAFELKPFAEAIRSRADAVMVAHLLIPALDERYPASFSPAIITGLLRQELQYDGLVMTDDMTMGAVVQHYDLGEAAVAAVAAGADIVMVAHDYAKAKVVLEALRQAVASGALPKARVDESVYRVLALKQKYRLSDEPAGEPDVAAINARIRKVLGRR